MSIFSSYKKIFLLGFIIVILIAIPFSIYIAQKRQRTISQAAKSTVLSFEPASLTAKVDETLIFDVVLNPDAGTASPPTPNQISFVKLSINFDPAKIATVSDSLTPNLSSPNTLTSVLEETTYESGKISISLSIGADPTKVVTAKTKIAVLKLKALSLTDANNPTRISFANDTQALSIASSDQTSENVLSTTTPASVVITPATPTSTPTPTNTPTPVPGAILSPTPTGLSTQSATLTPTPTVALPLPTQIILPPPGPGEKILGIGVIGIILTIIGGALFILL